MYSRGYSTASGGCAAAGALPKALRLLRSSAHDVLATASMPPHSLSAVLVGLTALVLPPCRCCHVLRWSGDVLLCWPRRLHARLRHLRVPAVVIVLAVWRAGERNSTAFKLTTIASLSRQLRRTNKNSNNDKNNNNDKNDNNHNKNNNHNNNNKQRDGRAGKENEMRSRLACCSLQ